MAALATKLAQHSIADASHYKNYRIDRNNKIYQSKPVAYSDTSPQH
jgi:hypothetical protein